MLPYSGTEDCLVALDTVQEDVGPDQVRVVVIDTTGARIDAVEAVGITHLIEVLDAANMEAVLVGLGESGIEILGRDPLNQLVTAPALSQGIVLGFQLAMASR